MDIALPGLKAGAYSPAKKGDTMTDPVKVLEVLGSAGVVSAFTWWISRNDQKRRDEVTAASNRVAEALALRESDRQAHALVLNRLNDLETWKTHADGQITDLRSDKVALETKIFTLTQQIAALNVQITQYQQNEVTFTAQINELQEMLTAKKAELHTAHERLDAIKTAHAKGEMTQSMLYQEREGEKMMIVTRLPEEPL